MRAGDKMETEDGAAAALLCARCKRSVKSGEQHQCNQEEKRNEDSKREKGNWSTGTPFPL